MGFTPIQIDQMSIWEFMACRDGWDVAHGGQASGGSRGGFSDEWMRENGIEGF
ncbi:hypothetical protein [Thalassovita sp.]|uniref:hypothetical protein n=1 Tax=Thalassovita sp. TaxID=1979401 RepID=UPI002B26B5D6|nr:hypothetical protein [Thalassovita sp.]